MVFRVALGPIAFFITSEIVVQKYRSVVQSMVFAVNTLVNFTFSFVTLPLFDQFTVIFKILKIDLKGILIIVDILYIYLRLPFNIIADLPVLQNARNSGTRNP